MACDLQLTIRSLSAHALLRGLKPILVHAG